jgi:phenylpyruvate tautomerase PptA (4-oxalocrotonate tautomerase family)
MHLTDGSNKDSQSTGSSGGLSRRDILVTGTIAAGAAAGTSAVLAQTVPATSFGAPLVEMSFPVGVLTFDQKAAMIKGVSEVVHRVMKLAPDPANKLFVEIFETPEGGFGVNGQAVVPHGK